MASDASPSLEYRFDLETKDFPIHVKFPDLLFSTLRATPDARVRGRRSLRLRLTLLALGALPALATPIPAQDPATPDTPAPSEKESGIAPRPNPLDLDMLLADPVASRPEFHQFRDIRRELAATGNSATHFERAAERLAALRAYTTAIELLWFASRMQTDPAVTAGYQDRMREWAQQATPAEMIVEEGDQLLVAGRQSEAVAAHLRALELNPFAERAHFRLADAWRIIYKEKYEDDLSLAPLEIRVRIFQDAWVHYLLCLEVDPLFYDAYYGLSELRGLFPENHEFLMRTQPLTQRALDYRGAVLPVLQRIESTAEDAALMAELGEAFETIGVPDYAVFAYQCAVRLGDAGPSVPARIDALRAQHFSAR